MGNVHFILDEAASLGPKMTCIEDAIDKYRGYGVRLQLYYQSTSQLKACFPNEQDQTVLANVTQVFVGVNDSTAEYISNRLGDQTVVLPSGGHNSGWSESSSSNAQGSSGSSGGRNDNWSLSARRLLKPDEILSMSSRLALTFVPGMRPILTNLERYYEVPREAANASALKIFVGTVVVVAMATFWLLGLWIGMEKMSHD